MSVAWRLRHRRCCLLELGCRSQRIFCVWLHCQSVLLGTRDPQRGTREPTCSVFFFFTAFPRLGGLPGQSVSLFLSLSLSLLLPPPPARLPLLATCLPPLAAPSHLPPQKGVGPSLISGKLALTYPALGWVRERGRCLQGSVAHCMGCSRARGLMRCCNRVNLQLRCYHRSWGIYWLGRIQSVVYG